MKAITACILLLGLISSCSKSNTDSPPPTVSEYLATLSLGRVKSTSFSAGAPAVATDVYSESMIAFFPDPYVAGFFIDGGTVKFKDSLLKKAVNGIYTNNVSNPNASTSFVNYVSGGGTWNASGNTGNLVPSFSATADADLPSVVGNLYTEAPVVDRTKSFTVNLGTAITNCDSLRFTIAGGNNTSVSSKTLAGTTTSYTFSTTELSTISASPAPGGVASGLIIIAASKYKKTTVTNHKILLLNSTSRSFSAHIQ